MEKLAPELRMDRKATVPVPKTILVELRDMAERLDEILETLDLLTDKKAMKDIELSKKEIAEGKFVEAKSAEDIERILG